MTRSKKIFAAFAIIFALILVYVVFDISSRTTFPGSRPSKGENTDRPVPDSVRSDSAH